MSIVLETITDQVNQIRHKFINPTFSKRPVILEIPDEIIDLVLEDWNIIPAEGKRSYYFHIEVLERINDSNAFYAHEDGSKIDESAKKRIISIFEDYLKRLKGDVPSTVNVSK